MVKAGQNLRQVQLQLSVSTTAVRQQSLVQLQHISVQSWQRHGTVGSSQPQTGNFNTTTKQQHTP